MKKINTTYTTPTGKHQDLWKFNKNRGMDAGRWLELQRVGPVRASVWPAVVCRVCPALACSAQRPWGFWPGTGDPGAFRGLRPKRLGVWAPWWLGLSGCFALFWLSGPDGPRPPATLAFLKPLKAPGPPTPVPKPPWAWGLRARRSGPPRQPPSVQPLRARPNTLQLPATCLRLPSADPSNTL